MSIESQGHFFTIYFPGFVCLCFTRLRYQESVYRTIGPLVHIVLVRFGLQSGYLLGKSCHSVDYMFSLYFDKLSLIRYHYPKLHSMILVFPLLSKELTFFFAITAARAPTS